MERIAFATGGGKQSGRHQGGFFGYGAGRQAPQLPFFDYELLPAMFLHLARRSFDGFARQLYLVCLDTLQIFAARTRLRQLTGVRRAEKGCAAGVVMPVLHRTKIVLFGFGVENTNVFAALAIEHDQILSGQIYSQPLICDQGFEITKEFQLLLEQKRLTETGAGLTGGVRSGSGERWFDQGQERQQKAETAQPGLILSVGFWFWKQTEVDPFFVKEPLLLLRLYRL